MRVELTAPPWATHLLSDLTDWKKSPQPVGEIGPFDLPDDAYFEYAFLDAQGILRPDPGNTRPILNPWWTFASNLSGPDYRPDPLAQVSGRSPMGQVLRLDFKSRLLRQNRRLLIYSPPGMANAALPHLVFQDGKAYFGWGKVSQVLDRLLAADRVQPAHLVFVPPIQRTREYAFNSLYRDFLWEELLPFVENRVPNNGYRVAWGASLGGLLSAQLAWQRPDLFQKVVAQSGAFLFSEDMDLANPFVGQESFRQEVETGSSRALDWLLQCGRLEWLLESNRNLARVLAESGMSVRLDETNAGHNWINWRNGLASGLEFALGK